MKRCVYTVLTGGYEPLNEQPVARESGLPFICFTDDPDTARNGWEIRPLARMFPADDDIRNQRTYKLQPHLMLPEFDQSLYLDNSVRLTATPERIFEAADLATGICLPTHSFRASLLEEFLVIIEAKIDDPQRVREQLEHYKNAFPELLEAPPLWSGLMLRDHHAPKVRAAMEFWLAHVYRYSRRDQLSGTVAFHLAGLERGILPIDNHESEFHTWPHLTGRKTERRIWTEPPETLALQNEKIELQHALGAMEHERNTARYDRDMLQYQHDVLQHERNVAQHERDVLQYRHDVLLHERDVARHERDVLQYQHDVLLHERDVAKHERDILQHERDTIQHDHDVLRQQLGLLQQAHDALLRSTSWRVTAPLRGLKFAARNAFVKED